MKRWGVVAASVALAGLLASCSGGGPPSTSATTTSRSATASAKVPAPPKDSVLLATARGAIAGYAAPGGQKTVTIPATWHGAVSTLPVIATRRGWLDVRLAQRPNESTAWVHLADVSLTSTPYKILVDLKTTHLYLFKSDRLIYSAPAGVGTAADPTPTGQFFVAFFAAPPSSGYGAFVMVSSAHSNTISDWEMSGDAMMAIHGPLGADSEIGTTGADVSHGCVRLHESDLAHLRTVPAGSPIEVVAS